MKLIGFKKKIITIIFIIMILTNLSIYLNNFYINHKKKREEYPKCSQAVTNSELPVGVFTFFAPNDILIFSNLSLEESYLYYIFIELIIPHNVSTIRIRIWDPVNCKYDIFESEMFFEPDYGRHFEIPFGTALTGNYTIEFYVETANNVNILINIEKGPKFLHDKLDWQDIDNIIFYDVIRFHDNMYIGQNFRLDKDTMYTFYFGRVSVISKFNSSEIRVDINLIDSLRVEFEIFSNELMNDIEELNRFRFGTANDGLYTLKIRLYCQVNYVNIGFAVVNSYKIVEAIDPNQTNPITTNTSESANITYHIPNEYIIGAIVFAGILCGIPIIIVVYHNKKNLVSTNFKIIKLEI